jgi:hypothetical protein
MFLPGLFGHLSGSIPKSSDGSSFFPLLWLNNGVFLAIAKFEVAGFEGFGVG